MKPYFFKPDHFFAKTCYACSIAVTTLLIGGCQVPSPPLYVQASPIIEKPISRPIATVPSCAQFSLSLPPDIRKAYAMYQKTGKASIITTKEFQQFPFGQSEPIVYCQPLRACDIALQAGEKITGVYPGDTARWKYEQATSGNGGDAQSHLIFKPTDFDIATNVIITTTRRSYHIGLVSKADTYVRQVSFWYPEDIEAKWAKVNQDAEEKWQEENQQTVASLPNINVASLNFNYSIQKPSRNLSWMPMRTFNDGTHVYIEMPSSMQTSDAPALFVVGTDGQKALVNYRVRGSYYIVDQLFQQAVLVTGVGRNQQRITITYNG